VANRYLILSTTLQYSFYLACSWLWCLGGFLPLILARDYGWPALAAFTFFNVGGAIAMGFYFKNRRHQHTFESKHKPMIGFFSYVTIAYQLFFIAWLGTLISQPFLPASVLAIAFIIYLSRGGINHWALIIYLLSIALFIIFLRSDTPPIDISSKDNWPHAILPLAIGFLLSPYLDITFHRAYKSSDNPKVSFAIGFGIMFLSLLGFVVFYAGSLSDVFFFQAVPSAIIYPVIGFLVLQIAFTIAAHCSELCKQQYLKPSHLASAVVAFSLVSTGFLTIGEGETVLWSDLPLAETLYKSFLFFYSLVFPLYLLVGKSKPIFLWLLGISTPAYCVGFLIGGEYSYSLTIGVAVLFLAVAFTRKKELN